MTDVNLTIGRFQPFTKGHLQMCKDGYDKNGFPTVVLMITNKRPDSRHPFSNDLVAKELEIVKKNYPFVEDIFLVSNADIVKAGQLLKENGYTAHLWLCGDDRESQYKRMTSNPKYREQGGYPDDFTTYTGTGRTEGVSGTAVREAIKNGDRETFKKLMPKGTDKLFKEFEDEISKVNESYQPLSEYLLESILSKKTDMYDKSNPDDPATWKVGDILFGQIGDEWYIPIWYKITGKTEKTFTCRRLTGKVVSGNKSGQWEEVPTDEEYESKDYVLKLKNNKIQGVELSLWEGDPVSGYRY